MEYSRASLLNSPDVSPATHPHFFADLANKLTDLGLTALIGPALTPSGFVESHRGDEAHILLEYSALDDRANILRYVDASAIDGKSTVETYWAASSTNKDSKTPTKKPPATTKSCQRFCSMVKDTANRSVHQGTFTHSVKND
jgi:hypothetical protein